MDKRSKAFVTVFVILICFSTAVTFYRYMIQEDFAVVQSDQ